MAVTVEVPPVQFVKILPCMVFKELPASVLTRPAIVVAPLTVIFEKLLLLILIVLPVAHVAVLVNKVTDPPAFFV